MLSAPTQATALKHVRQSVPSPYSEFAHLLALFCTVFVENKTVAVTSVSAGKTSTISSLDDGHTGKRGKFFIFRLVSQDVPTQR